MKMSRLVGIILTLMLVLALALSITSCSDGENDPPTPDTPPEKDITGVSFENAEYTYDGTEKTLAITGTLPEGVSAEYTGNTATDAGAYDASVTLTGEGYKTLTLTATLTIKKADITGITFEGQTVTYDGEAHTIVASGDFPDGASVTYENNTASNAGTYTATLTVTHKNYNSYVETATLVIKKATVTDVSLESATFTYDGTEKTLSYVGTLPDGVSEEWSGNAATEIGNHPVTLKLYGDNYEEITLTAYIIIEEAAVDTDTTIEGITFNGGEFVYDGTEKSIEVSGDVPDGVSVTYTGNNMINAGTYKVTAILEGEGYKTLTLTAELKINKAKITDITFNNATFTYDKNVSHSIKISGTLPSGVDVKYTGNGVTEAGTYGVTAVISGDNYEELILNATITVISVNGSPIITPPMPL